MRYNQIKPQLSEEILDEVKMSPSALQKFANSPEAEGMLVGIEFEMSVPGVEDVDDDPNWEYDYDQDERARSIDDIIDFFRNGEFSNMGSRAADAARSEMYEQYEEWLSDQVRDSSQLQDLIREKLADYIDPILFEDQAREELGDDADDDAVQSRAKELAEESIDEHMTDQDGEYWDQAYDDAYDEAMGDWRNDGDFDEEAWLSDIGVDSMSDAEREWSFDWPHMYDTNEGNGGGEDLDSLAADFSEAMGGARVNTSSGYHGAQRDGSSWIIEPDGSIDADRGDAGLEFVSPPMPLKQGLDTLKQFYAWAKERGCTTNDSTGLHMNISVPDMSTETLDYVKLALFMGDEHVLKQFGRQYNSYCSSAMGKIRQRIRPEEVSTILNTVKQNLNSLASKIIHSGITEKYTSINTRGKYVEFRGPGGDYLDRDPLELVNTALRLALSLRIATNPESYKQEYAKKLYKLVEQSPGADDSITLFSKYAVGELSKEELSARLEFSRRERASKKQQPSITRAIYDPALQPQIEQLPSGFKNYIRELPDRSDRSLAAYREDLTDGSYGTQLTKDQADFIIKLIDNEIEFRTKQQSEKKQYWVTKRDGSGGRQMVTARNENEAIIIGGSNLGMSREASIAQLKATEKVPYADDAAIQASLPDEWKAFDQRISDASLGLLRGNLETLSDQRWQHRNLDDDQVSYLLKRIRKELSAASDQAGTQGLARKAYPYEARAMLEQLPVVWRDFVLNIPNKDEQILRDTVEIGRTGRWVQDGSMSQQLANVIVNIASEELSYRAATGEEKADSGVQLQFKDAAPPTSREVFDSLPQGWQHWFTNINNHSDRTIQQNLDAINDPENSYSNNDLSAEQRSFIVNTMTQELQRRQSNSPTNSEDEQAMVDSLPTEWKDYLSSANDHTVTSILSTASDMNDSPRNFPGLNADQLEFLSGKLREIARGRSQPTTEVDLPEQWQNFITAIETTSDLTLLGILRNVSTSDAHVMMGLTEQQLAHIRVAIKRALRQRGINPDDPGSLTSAQAQAQIADAERAAQQQRALVRDDPVTSNDPEAQDGPGMWMVGNHTYGRETLRATSRDDAIRQFAERNGITVDDLTSDRSFVAQLQEPVQQELDLREMRRLAGLV